MLANLNFNETEKMLNFQKVYQRKGYLKVMNALGPRYRHKGIPPTKSIQGQKLVSHTDKGLWRVHPSANVAGFYSEGKANGCSFLNE